MASMVRVHTLGIKGIGDSVHPEKLLRCLIDARFLQSECIPRHFLVLSWVNISKSNENSCWADAALERIRNSW